MNLKLITRETLPDGLSIDEWEYQNEAVYIKVRRQLDNTVTITCLSKEKPQSSWEKFIEAVFG